MRRGRTGPLLPSKDMGPAQVLRWLACPVFFVAFQWCLLLGPRAVLELCPRLWAVAEDGKGAEEVLPPHPKTITQAFELGRLAGAYHHAGCEGMGRGGMMWPSPRSCQETLRLAGETVGARGPLTPSQLEHMGESIAELAAQRSLVDRVLGFFCFVNMIWLVSIVGIVATVGPCVAVMCGAILVELVAGLYENLLKPAALLLHRTGVLEVAAYALAAAFCAQGLRYPDGQSGAGTMVALTGGLALAPCWAYSTRLHSSGSNGDSGDARTFLTLSYVLAFLALAPMAVAHDSSLAGFLAVLALHGALGFILFAFGFGFVIGFESADALARSAGASLALVVGFSLARIANVSSAYIRPFARGAMVMGNVVYFLALLILSSKWRQDMFLPSYAARQAAMVGSLTVALFVGNVFSMPCMSNTAAIFLVLWLMEKELEYRWGPSSGAVLLFLNFVALYALAHYLQTHPELVVSVFDARGVYI